MKTKEEILKEVENICFEEGYSFSSKGLEKAISLAFEEKDKEWNARYEKDLDNALKEKDKVIEKREYEIGAHKDTIREKNKEIQELRDLLNKQIQAFNNLEWKSNKKKVEKFENIIGWLIENSYREYPNDDKTSEFRNKVKSNNRRIRELCKLKNDFDRIFKENLK